MDGYSYLVTWQGCLLAPPALKVRRLPDSESAGMRSLTIFVSGEKDEANVMLVIFSCRNARTNGWDMVSMSVSEFGCCWYCG